MGYDEKNKDGNDNARRRSEHDYVRIVRIDRQGRQKARKFGFPFRHSLVPAAIRSRPRAYVVADTRRLDNNLRIVRSQRRIKQYELAEAIGISKTALSNIECGRSVPSVGTALILAEMLRVSVHELFHLADEHSVV